MWQFLNKPNNFKRDWYGELTNQCGHTLLGILAANTFCDVWFLIAGEMPVRSWTFLAVFLPYAIGIETIVQRWAPGDAWFDSLMFGFGAAWVLLPFYEVSQAGLVSTVEYTPHVRLIIMVAWAFILFMRVKRRYDAEKRQS
jgi:hypothetical protein